MYKGTNYFRNLVNTKNAIVGNVPLNQGANRLHTIESEEVVTNTDCGGDNLSQFPSSILFTNQYVTCFVRFGRIFSGVGLVLLGYGFINWSIVGKWLGWFTALLGVAAVAIILAIPDNFEIYKPIFHVKVIWLVAMGWAILKQGVNLPEPKS